MARSGAWQAAAQPDLRGQRVVVTGANTGLGLVTAKTLAGWGASVVMAVRDPAKGTAAAARIAAEPGAVRPRVAVLNLADLSSVRRFGAQEADEGPIGLLVNNAGVMLVPRRELTPDGFEMHMGVNHLGHFALTAALLPLMTPDARVVSVSSIAHRAVRRVDPSFGLTGDYTPMKAYGQSKLAVLTFALELHRRLEQAGSSVRSVAAHPGWSATAEAQPDDRPSPSVAFSRWATAVLGSRPVNGARPQLDAGVAPMVRGGDFFGPRALVRGAPHLAAPSAAARDQDQASWLWQRSEELTGVEFGLPGPVSSPC